MESVTGPFSSVTIIPHAIAFLKLAWIRTYAQEQLVPFHLPENEAWTAYGANV